MLEDPFQIRGPHSEDQLAESAWQRRIITKMGKWLMVVKVEEPIDEIGVLRLERLKVRINVIKCVEGMQSRVGITGEFPGIPAGTRIFPNFFLGTGKAVSS